MNRPNNILVVKFAYIMYNNKSNDTEKVIAVTIEKIKRIYARVYPEIDSVNESIKR